MLTERSGSVSSERGPEELGSALKFKEAVAEKFEELFHDKSLQKDAHQLLVSFPKDDLEIKTFPHLQRTNAILDLQQKKEELDKSVEDAFDIFTSDFVSVNANYDTYVRASGPTVFDRKPVYYECDDTTTSVGGYLPLFFYAS